MHISFLSLIFTTCYVFAELECIEVSEWNVLFTQRDSEGCITVWDSRDPKFQCSDLERATQRYSPASTFKIPHALFVLEEGWTKDKVILWDGKKRFHEPWNQDQTLELAIQNSTVWVFEQFAKSLGNKEQEYLNLIQYGNAKATGKQPFWIKGNLAISAIEQIQFLQQLYDNKLPFKPEHQTLVKTLITQESNDQITVRGKTGWNGKVSWWVGWLESSDDVVFIAMNMDTPKGMKDLPLRAEIIQAFRGQLLQALDIE